MVRNDKRSNGNSLVIIEHTQSLFAVCWLSHKSYSLLYLGLIVRASANGPRLVSIGEDRMLFEYDVANSSITGGIKLKVLLKMLLCSVYVTGII